MYASNISSNKKGDTKTTGVAVQRDSAEGISSAVPAMHKRNIESVGRMSRNSCGQRSSECVWLCALHKKNWANTHTRTNLVA